MFFAITAVYVAGSDSLIRTSAIMRRRFPIRQNDSKGKSAKKAVAPLFLLLLKRVKAILGTGRFSPIHSWTVSSWLSNTSKKNPYVCRLGLEPVKKGAC